MSERELTAWASMFQPPTPQELDGTEPVGAPPPGSPDWPTWIDVRWPATVADAAAAAPE